MTDINRRLQNEKYSSVYIFTLWLPALSSHETTVFLHVLCDNLSAMIQLFTDYDLKVTRSTLLDRRKQATTHYSIKRVIFRHLI